MQMFRELFFDKLTHHDIVGSMGVIEAAVATGMTPAGVLLSIVNAAMEQVGKRQAEQEIALSEVFVMSAIVDSALDWLFQRMPDKPQVAGTIVLGSAPGDFHSLGRKIVGSFLRVAGFRVVDLGVNVSAAQLVDTAVTEKAAVIGVSALLLHTAENIKEVRQLLDDRKLQRRIKLAVGGAAFTIDRQLARTVGADATAINALGAVGCMRALTTAANRWQP